MALFDSTDVNIQYRYDIGTGSMYIGFANRTLLTSDPVWTIRRIMLDGTGTPTIAQWSITGSWDSRVGLSYT